jgi:Ca-activated chloride channel family protein
VRLGALACAVLVVLAGCTATPAEAVRLSVLAGPELADVVPLLADLRRDTGVELVMDFQESADALVPGQYRHDLAWLTTDRSFQLKAKQSGHAGPLPMATSVMTSPLVVGVKPAKAAELRAGGQPSWADLADRAARGELRFGMPDPHFTTSGLAALIGVATAAAGTGGALRPEDVTCDRLRGFFAGRAFTGGADEFVRGQDDVDALVEHESVLLSLNASGKLRQPLDIVYPRDGIVLSEYPLLLLDPAKREAYDRVVAWLRTEPAQRALMERTARRPVDPAVPRTDRLREPIGNALYFPDRQEVVDTLLAAYDRAVSGAADQVVFVLDYSTSMAGPRRAALQQAFAALSGFDSFHVGEVVTVVRFAGEVLEERTTTVTGPSDVDALRDALAAGGLADGTAIWSALDHAYRAVRPGGAAVVLMTDGENNTGIDADEFLRRKSADARTYAIRFGEADPAELDRVARATGGRVVDATDTSLTEALGEIRGCR